MFRGDSLPLPASPPYPAPSDEQRTGREQRSSHKKSGTRLTRPGTQSLAADSEEARRCCVTNLGSAWTSGSGTEVEADKGGELGAPTESPTIRHLTMRARREVALRMSGRGVVVGLRIALACALAGRSGGEGVIYSETLGCRTGSKCCTVPAFHQSSVISFES